MSLHLRFEISLVVCVKLIARLHPRRTDQDTCGIAFGTRHTSKVFLLHEAGTRPCLRLEKQHGKSFQSNCIEYQRPCILVSPFLLYARCLPPIEGEFGRGACWSSTSGTRWPAPRWDCGGEALRGGRLDLQTIDKNTPVWCNFLFFFPLRIQYDSIWFNDTVDFTRQSGVASGWSFCLAICSNLRVGDLEA